MTNDDFPMQTLRRQLRHVSTRTALLYPGADTTAAAEYAEGTVDTDTAQPDREGEDTP
ncbi:hypothetical protein [Streptomyces sp. NBC_00268]|uniref:hypothetical protein n=1 Tax=Streptomyces sp. NBC_00268 TaxID=2975695 RepID=UPI0022509900|nr:hypothetical protein [Streptomyces sp. NBC_00268]MCX5187577.1 hypothetical protein [Streptomyces sp. NBC_00268]